MVTMHAADFTRTLSSKQNQFQCSAGHKATVIKAAPELCKFIIGQYTFAGGGHIALDTSAWIVSEDVLLDGPTENRTGCRQHLIGKHGCRNRRQHGSDVSAGDGGWG